MLGLASSLHPLVGGWSTIAMGFAWWYHRDGRPTLREMLPWLLLGLLFAAPGLYFSLRLTMGIDPESETFQPKDDRSELWMKAASRYRNWSGRSGVRGQESEVNRQRFAMQLRRELSMTASRRLSSNSRPMVAAYWATARPEGNWSSRAMSESCNVIGISVECLGAHRPAARCSRNGDARNKPSRYHRTPGRNPN